MSSVEHTHRVTCICGKQGFSSKKAAKQVARSLGRRYLNSYRCEYAPTELWHLGHLPTVVKRGHASRDSIHQAVRPSTIGYHQ